ncbi:hypothetical protein ACO0LB_06470 [Undibacterium sp. SXout7W]|uniref:hypothetical protein n=1 Tax=Undibacterium sp. SXout7W TaxID=3413049 RepID=UPI003BF2B798
MKFSTIFDKSIIVIPLIAGALCLLVQQYIFPDAGKRIESKRSFYTFALSHWNNEVYKYFNEIATSGTYVRTSLSTGKKEINLKYLQDVNQFCTQMQQLSRALDYQGNEISSMSIDMTPLARKVLPLLDKDKRDEIDAHFKAFLKVTEIHKQKQKDFAKFQEELIRLYSDKRDNLSDDEKIKLDVQKIEAGMKLYTGKDALLPINGDPFTYIREFGDVSAAIFSDYDFLIDTYNKESNRMEAYRNAILFLIAIGATAITVRKELRNYASKDASNAEHM